jgi:hypothetical protein
VGDIRKCELYELKSQGVLFSKGITQDGEDTSI